MPENYATLHKHQLQLNLQVNFKSNNGNWLYLVNKRLYLVVSDVSHRW